MKEKKKMPFPRPKGRLKMYGAAKWKQESLKQSKEYLPWYVKRTRVQQNIGIQ